MYFSNYFLLKNGWFSSHLLVSLPEGIRGMMIRTIVVVNHQDGRINAVQLHGALQLGDLVFFFQRNFLRATSEKLGKRHRSFAFNDFFLKFSTIFVGGNSWSNLIYVYKIQKLVGSTTVPRLATSYYPWSTFQPFRSEIIVKRLVAIPDQGITWVFPAFKWKEEVPKSSSKTMKLGKFFLLLISDMDNFFVWKRHNHLTKPAWERGRGGQLFRTQHPETLKSATYLHDLFPVSDQ